MVLRIFLEAILSFFWRPLYGATHLFGSHSKLLLKAPIWCYASFWKPFLASFEGPYMLLRIFLEAILTFFWRPLYGATHLFGNHSKTYIVLRIFLEAILCSSFEGPYIVLRIFLEDIQNFFWRPLYGAPHLFGSHSKLLLKAPLSCYAFFWKPFSASFEGPYMVLRIFLEHILNFFWRPLYRATHLFGSHSQLLLKAPIWCYASFWNTFSASFEGPYMVLRIFLEAILSFFWRPLYGATHFWGSHSQLPFAGPYMVLRIFLETILSFFW
jgi:hypothetical protein